MGIRKKIMKNRTLQKEVPIFKPQLTSTFPISHRLFISFLFLSTLIVCGFSFCLFIGLNVNVLFLKVESMILGKALSFLFQRIGWAGGLFLTLIWYFMDGETAPSLGNLMLPAGASGTSSSDSTAKPSPSALDQKADELLEKNIEALKTSLGEGERISEVRETVKENFDVKTPGEEFELIQNLEKEVNLNAQNLGGESSIKIPSSLNKGTETRGGCQITKAELNEIRNHQSSSFSRWKR